MPQSNWGARIFRGFALSVSPRLEMGAEVSTQTADFALSVTPQLEMGVSTRSAAMGLSVTPELEMAAQAVNAREFALSVTPGLEMSAASRSVADFALSVTPQLGMSVYSTPEVEFALSVTPQLEMDGSDVEVAEFALSVTPALGMAGVGVEPPAAVVFDAVGSGGTHTAAAGAYVLAFVNAGNGSVSGVTCGGTPMSKLDSIASTTAVTGYMYGLASVPGGPQSVVVSGSGSAKTLSYKNVASVGTPQHNSGNSAGNPSPTQNISCSDGDVIAQVWMDNLTQIASLTGGTLRYTDSTPAGIAVSDATETTTFGFTRSGFGTDKYLCIAVVLSP